MTTPTIEDTYRELERISEVINDHLWYVNPEKLRTALTTIDQNAREEEREAWMKGERCFMCGKEMLNPDGLSNTCARCFEEA